MQYFLALKLGQKRVAESREYLNTLTGGKAMPALALAATKSNVWQAVGEENLYAFVDESAGFILTDNSGYILALVDKSGSSKTIVQGVTQLQKENLEKNEWNSLLDNEKLKRINSIEDNIYPFEGTLLSFENYKNLLGNIKGEIDWWVISSNPSIFIDESIPF